MAFIRELADIRGTDVATAGGKGANLGELVRAGFPVPPGFVLETAAYDAFVAANRIGPELLATAIVPAGASPQAYEEASARIAALFEHGTLPAEVAAELAAAYARLGPDAAVAVRSSATAEDLPTASFAGQQETYLNVRGQREVAAAVVSCFASLWTARAMAYRAREGIDPAGVSLAVVVQRMAGAEASGVMFTANPANGRRDQLAISAAWGLGESVVGGSVSTEEVIVDGGTRRVVSRQAGGQQVRTVPAGSGTLEEPLPEALRGGPVLDDAAAGRLADIGLRIAALFGVPQDIEWSLAGGDVSILQARPITALPEPSAEPPTDWSLPYPHGMYFRASIVEQLPDPLTPLFADMIDGSVTRSLNALLARAFGKQALREGDVRLPTVNGYAYYYYRNSGMLRVMAKAVPAMAKLARGKANMGIAGWRDYSHPRYARTVQEWQAKPLERRGGAELLAGVGGLLDAGTEYYTAVQSVIPVAASSEMLFTWFYDKLVRRPGGPPASAFLLGFDSEPIRAEKSLYELAAWTRQQDGLAEALESLPAGALAAALRSGAIPGAVPVRHWESWRERFQQHLARFGHAVYNLDFAVPVPADDPASLLETIRFYLRGQGQDPHQRQQLSAERRQELAGAVQARLGPLRRAVFRRLLRWAQESAPVREDALADVGLAWPLLRGMLLELGRRLVASGALAAPEDVFWLRHSELQAAVDSGLAEAANGTVPAPTGTSAPVRPGAVEQRKMLWRGQRRATAPQLLPERRWVTLLFGSMMPAGAQDQRGGSIRGIGASPGQVTAPANVLGGQEDFGRMRPGDVLVARMTTPAWTSLFAMASAVVTDVGGPLSHSSIVAREYGIPAVLATGSATRQLATGDLVRVDGDAGTVTVLRPASSGTTGGWSAVVSSP
ncbi:PEP/pyruvate-binding pyruvate phosphate dikinase [Arthrobacter crystallopoietes BAB-32]|uniref:PEP/pyruvate-binding pyruvate phosphate dikinase n=1 Tax=Arthrobacter crystallopoietes BAB-32 TaxID=1246476 RepID=N1VAJ3_9MICC|nr:PEP/pyruvate-binding domain-containing protein [Arthrobacter crystallopoietes]EMY35303.1 PEP/pyruvate-binding pyruvate phosphate dikinase [Arthrobacter crystallopoietes BAB-32]